MSKVKSIQGCRHFWITDTSGLGKCRYCGTTRQFPNYEVPKLKLGAMRGIRHYEFAPDPAYWQRGSFSDRALATTEVD